MRIRWRSRRPPHCLPIMASRNGYRPRQCTSLDSDVLESLRDGHQQVITLEDGQLEGGWGEKVTAYYANHHVSDGSRNPHVLNFGAARNLPTACRWAN